MTCGLPLSKSWKSSLCRLPMARPWSSLTTTRTRTSLTLTLNVVASSRELISAAAALSLADGVVDWTAGTEGWGELDWASTMREAGKTRTQAAKQEESTRNVQRNTAHRRGSFGKNGVDHATLLITAPTRQARR